MDNTIYVRVDSKKRLYLRAIIGTKLPYEEAKYQKYMKYFDKGKCVWDEEVLLKLSEKQLIELYKMLDNQIEEDYRYQKNGDGRFIDCQ